MIDYNKEPLSDYFLIDIKSFYSSVECVDRGLDPLTTNLVVLSTADNVGGNGLILASSPVAKATMGISNVSRFNDLPYPLPKDLILAPPRMNLYIKRNLEINNIFRDYVADEDLLIYSVDESILKVEQSLNLFTDRQLTRSQKRRQLAKIIQSEVKKQTGLVCTVGIGDNPLLAKLALDNEAKHNDGFIAEWNYEDVPTKVWGIKNMTDFWGIGKKMKLRFRDMGITTIKELAHADPWALKSRLGILGLQYYYHANGVDRTDIAVPPPPTQEKSYGNSQVLPKDYVRKEEIELIIKEMAEQVAIRIRKHKCKTQCIHVSIRPSFYEEEKGFSRQLAIPATDNTKELQEQCLYLFRKHYTGYAVRNVGITYKKLVWTDVLQLNLFEDPQEQINHENLDLVIDKIRQKYGFEAIIHASSALENARSVKRANVVGGHAGGHGGLDNDN
ncbi:Y-family DNA polymerase [Enterococcus sp. AZ103]|uniref:Y-family DNA polymerase n=1 Tax=Enterococcus sp. AZ103 TaxID=2774628 RepID=UPI003F1E60E3